MTASDTTETTTRIRLYVSHTSRVPCIRAELATNHGGCMDFGRFLKRDAFQATDIEYAKHEERIDRFNFFPVTGQKVETLLDALQTFKIDGKAVSLVDQNENPIDSNSLRAEYESQLMGRALGAAHGVGRH